MTVVRVAAAADRRAIANTLAAAFAHDPVARWLLPEPDRDPLIFWALTRHAHDAAGCSDVAIGADGAMVGAGLWDPPNFHHAFWRQLVATPVFLRAMRGRMAYGRALQSAFEKNRPSSSFWYLAQLGASPPGHGAGSALLKHRLARITGPAYLESSNQANVPLYERFGFTVRSVIELPLGGPTCWGMWRPAG